MKIENYIQQKIEQVLDNDALSAEEKVRKVCCLVDVAFNKPYEGSLSEAFTTSIVDHYRKGINYNKKN